MSTRLTGTWVSRTFVVALAAIALGCGDGTTGPTGDAGSELDAILAEERAACAHLFALPDACGVVATEEAECVAGLARVRLDSAEPDCLPEHRAWVACIAGLADCPTDASGILCPEEYSALGLCAR